MQDSAAAMKLRDSDDVEISGPHGPVTIKLSEISKFYSGVAALADVNVEFYAGEVHAILGENGAGKSTLMNIISGALQPERGAIEFDGRRISAMSPEMAASLGISISFQHPAILDDLSVLENLQVALPQSLFEGESAHTIARRMLDAVGLRVPLQTRSDSLTVAQKHLLEIAKALAIEPKVLILDEPTASLDQEATDMLFGRIREVVKNGTSVIYITHRLAELRQIAQRVTVLRDGRVRGSAMVDEISERGAVEHDRRPDARIDVSAKGPELFERPQPLCPIDQRQEIQERQFRRLAWGNHRRRRCRGQRPGRVDARARRLAALRRRHLSQWPLAEAA